MLTLLGVSNYKMTAGNHRLTNTFDRDSLLDSRDSPREFRRRYFKKNEASLGYYSWNSVGLRESMGYDQQGNRKEKSCAHLHWQSY